MDRIRRSGADLVVIGERYADALAASEAWAAESGAMRIHAYDQPETLLGQGTIGLEFEQQSPALDTLLVARGLVDSRAKAQAMSLALGIRPEDNLLSSAIIAARDEG